MTAPLLPSVVGPTGSGKTSFAVALARAVAEDVRLEVVSADSRQIYRALNIGTAKPTSEEVGALPHHLIDVADSHETWTAARFAEEAERVMGEVRSRGALPLLVGGSGLYLRAAEEGLFEGPQRDPGLREQLRREVDADGAAALHSRLATVDEDSARRLHPNDVRRVMRALEVWELTGTSLSEHHRRHREARPEMRCLRFGISWPTVTLDGRIARRVDRMMDAGWLDEVRSLLETTPVDDPAMQALGYPEMAALARGEAGRTATREAIVLATRRFAKRQRTWFRGVEPVHWYEVSGRADVELAVADAAAQLREAWRVSRTNEN